MYIHEPNACIIAIGIPMQMCSSKFLHGSEKKKWARNNWESYATSHTHACSVAKFLTIIVL